VPPAKNGKHMDLFQSKRKKNNGDFIRYGIRFPDDLYSIARTLVILLDYEKNLMTFLSSKKDFWSDSEDKLRRMAYLLHLLTYRKGAGKSTRNFEDGKAKKFLKGITQNKKLLEIDLADYDHWNEYSRFNSKRLWAALRDYVKPKSPLVSFFLTHQ